MLLECARDSSRLGLVSMDDGNISEIISIKKQNW